MITRSKYMIRFCAVILSLFFMMENASAREDKGITKEKVRRQNLNKAWFNKKLDNDAYYQAVDAPTVSGCQNSIVQTQRLMKVYRSKLSKAKTPRAKKKYMGALKAYKTYGETLQEIVKAFKAKENGKVATELFPILRKCEKRILLYTGHSVKRNYYFTPEVYPEYFKSKVDKEEAKEAKTNKSSAKTGSNKSAPKKK